MMRCLVGGHSVGRCNSPEIVAVCNECSGVDDSYSTNRYDVSVVPLQFLVPLDEFEDLPLTFLDALFECLDAFTGIVQDETHGLALGRRVCQMRHADLLLSLLLHQLVSVLQQCLQLADVVAGRCRP